MATKAEKKEKLNEVILGYRKVIAERYEYNNLLESKEIPDSFNEERVSLFRDFFLNYLYPPPEKREELNEAFEGLDDYIKHPEKLMRILIDSGSLIFKYGRHLPKILSAGLKALRSFRTANRFEAKLVDSAIQMELPTPYDQTEIETLIKSLPRKDLEEFIESSQALFETLHDRVLVKKIKEIVGHLVTKMKKRPKVYTSAEIRGLEIGAEIIREGDLLFDQLNKEEQKQIFNFVVDMERDTLDEIFSKK